MHEQMIGVPQSALYFPLSVLVFILISRIVGHILLWKCPKAFEHRQAMGVGFGITFHTAFFSTMIVLYCMNLD